MARPKEGEIAIKEGNRFIFRNGTWRLEGRGEFGSEANTKEANRMIRELREENRKRQSSKPKAKPPASKPASKKPIPKPTPKPAAKKPTPKPTPGANKAGYEGPGSRGQAPGGYAGKPKKQSLKSQVEELKKMRMAAEARNKAAAAKKKEEEKEKKRTMGSRKPGSMY